MVANPKPDPAAPLTYLSGFGNEQATEALPGVLPVGRNSPQQVAYGLYAEKFNAAAFTAPRASNYRSWFYRIRPSVVHGRFEPLEAPLIKTAPAEQPPVPPNQFRWDPFPIPEEPTDFLQGWRTLASNGNAAMQAGIGIHIYLTNQSMDARYFCNGDGELLIVPQVGRIIARTECGILDVAPGEIMVIPRGIRFAVDVPEGPSRGYICENYGAILQLPERGPIGTDGLANNRDFLAPVAAFEDRDEPAKLVTKLGGNLFVCELKASPLDVVAWHGNLYPYKYDLERFNTIGSISYDHPDPSIFTVLTSQSDTPGTANVDFVIFPPRWLVMEDTFRPPWYHRNVMSEFMGLVKGVYDAKTSGGFVPGGSSLHNCMVPHGPDQEVFDRASMADLAPQHLTDTMAFMFESRYLIEPTAFALEAPQLQADYAECWQGLKKNFNGRP